MSEAVKAKHDLTGRVFRKLTVLNFAYRESLPKGTRLNWLCKCQCGATTILPSGKLLSGRAKTCGTCPKDGGNRTEWPGYGSLKSALRRCYNTNFKSYQDYGARGISVCDRWRFGENGKTKFECFFEDMGPKPEGMSLDRIDNDGNYEPGNCRWADKRTQQQNQRRAIYVYIGGVPVPLKKCVRRFGLCYESVRFKVRKKGMQPLEAVRYFARQRAA